MSLKGRRKYEENIKMDLRERKIVRMRGGLNWRRIVPKATTVLIIKVRCKR
jgi:hypothetical protein